MDKVNEELTEHLRQAILFDKADMGNIQRFDPATGSLHIIAQIGFKRDFLDHFKAVKAFDSSSCGRAIGIASPILIPDVLQDIAFIPHRGIAKSAGFRAVKSVPITTVEKKVVGVLSTHFRDVKLDWRMNNTLNGIIKRIAEALQTAESREITVSHGSGV